MTLPEGIETEDVLREYVLAQGVNWWDFVRTPEYEAWAAKHLKSS